MRKPKITELRPLTTVGHLVQTRCFLRLVRRSSHLNRIAKSVKISKGLMVRSIGWNPLRIMERGFIGRGWCGQHMYLGYLVWIKQHLQIKAFYGYSENAVRSQLWIAVAVYCLLAIIRKELKADRELHEIQEILSVSIFLKMPILQAFSKAIPKNEPEQQYNQLKLFDL